MVYAPQFGLSPPNKKFGLYPLLDYSTPFEAPNFNSGSEVRGLRYILETVSECINDNVSLDTLREALELTALHDSRGV